MPTPSNDPNIERENEGNPIPTLDSSLSPEATIDPCIRPAVTEARELEVHDLSMADEGPDGIELSVTPVPAPSLSLDGDSTPEPSRREPIGDRPPHGVSRSGVGGLIGLAGALGAVGVGFYLFRPERQNLAEDADPHTLEVAPNDRPASSFDDRQSKSSRDAEPQALVAPRSALMQWEHTTDPVEKAAAADEFHTSYQALVIEYLSHGPTGEINPATLNHLAGEGERVARWQIMNGPFAAFESLDLEGAKAALWSSPLAQVKYYGEIQLSDNPVTSEVEISLPASSADTLSRTIAQVTTDPAFILIGDSDTRAFLIAHLNRIEELHAAGDTFTGARIWYAIQPIHGAGGFVDVDVGDGVTRPVSLRDLYLDQGTRILPVLPDQGEE